MSLRRSTVEADAGSETTGARRFSATNTAKGSANRIVNRSATTGVNTAVNKGANAAVNSAANAPADRGDRFEASDWSAEEVAWFRRGIARRWQGPRGRIALAGFFMLAAGYWSTVGYLVSGRLADPSELTQFEVSPGFDFDGYNLRPVPGTIPWEWQSGAGGTSGPRPLGLATGVPHSLLLDQNGGHFGYPMHAVPGYRPFGAALGYPRAMGESALEPLDGLR
jgi:hypothetical protein